MIKIFFITVILFFVYFAGHHASAHLDYYERDDDDRVATFLLANQKASYENHPDINENIKGFLTRVAKKNGEKGLHETTTTLIVDKNDDVTTKMQENYDISSIPIRDAVHADGINSFPKDPIMDDGIKGDLDRSDRFRPHHSDDDGILPGGHKQEDDEQNEMISDSRKSGINKRKKKFHKSRHRDKEEKDAGRKALKAKNRKLRERVRKKWPRYRATEEEDEQVIAERRTAKQRAMEETAADQAYFDELKMLILDSVRKQGREYTNERFQDNDDNRDFRVTWLEYLQENFRVDNEAEVLYGDTSDNGLTLPEEKALFHTVDANKDGALSFDEFEVLELLLMFYGKRSLYSENKR